MVGGGDSMVVLAASFWTHFRHAPRYEVRRLASASQQVPKNWPTLFTWPYRAPQKWRPPHLGPRPPQGAPPGSRRRRRRQATP
eukprot:3810961-Lingulodinium_polyedra.AAC.1